MLASGLEIGVEVAKRFRVVLKVACAVVHERVQQNPLRSARMERILVPAEI